MPVVITTAPSSSIVNEPFVIAGTASELEDGEQLLVLVDGRFEVARPTVTGGTWSTTLLFNTAGDRLIEVIQSDQDKAKIIVRLTDGAMTVISRGTWGARSPGPLAELTKPKRITLHHTVMPNLDDSATESNERARMRELQRFHMDGNGWSDIGYHYVIMPSGRIYEGRPNSKRGAHDGFNDGFGIAFDGTLSKNDTIGQKQFDSCASLCVQLAKQIGITNVATLVDTPIDKRGAKSAKLPSIFTHGARLPTTCAGDSGSGKPVRLNDLLEAVNSKL